MSTLLAAKRTTGSAQNATSLTALWSRFREHGDLKARESLIDHFGYLVTITAGRLAGGIPVTMDRQDLVSAGYIGLIRAVDQFDPGRAVKFETYAIALIRGAILELLRGVDFVPRSVRDKIRLLERAYASVEQQLGRPGTDEEVARALDTDVDGLYTMLSTVAQASVVSLDELLTPAGSQGQVRRADILADPDARGEVEGGVVAQARRKALQVALERLPERESHVLSLYYHEGLTLKEIGKVLQVSKSRVYQLQQQALKRLRTSLSADQPLFADG